MWWQSYVDGHLMREVVGQHHTAAGGAWAQTAFFPEALPPSLLPPVKWDKAIYVLHVQIHLRISIYRPYRILVVLL
ncbi:hypothetical protein MUK42_15603 [Musa troglodytarum]|uniref:Uncharacterized protein n=1 Tax=Musa troglodytarum TaxID=320322 RepID=A0A9E7G8Z1_9LILI|nr:hypothetical protein MUK42_15603 [Musa troglodytarum]